MDFCKNNKSKGKYKIRRILLGLIIKKKELIIYHNNLERKR